MNMSRIHRRTAFIALSFLALAACGNAGGNSGGNAPLDSSAIKDMTLGREDAPITVVEYASWTCPACQQFHDDVIPVLKSDYVQTGKVRFVFREKPTPPMETAIAGFVLARCAGEERYFDVIDELFERQQGITALARNGDQVTAALRQVGKNHGVETEEAYNTCRDSIDIRRAIAASKALGDAQGVSSTPTVFVNGERLEGSAWRYPEGMREVLDAKLAELAPDMLETETVEEAAVEEVSAEAPSGEDTEPNTEEPADTALDTDETEPAID